MIRRTICRGLLIGSPFFVALAVHTASHAAALDAGSKRIALHAQDGSRLEIGRVIFAHPRADGRIGFTVVIDHTSFTDHFLSMREFKCLNGQGEILCHVPYPYANPGTISFDDLSWLEHGLMFMFKKPSEFGAKLWNGVYFELRATPQGLEGRPQAIDLNLIGAPPARNDIAPFRKALRDPMTEHQRWFQRLTID